MSDPNRQLPPFVTMETHSQGSKPCMVCTDSSVSTASLGSGHYVVVVTNQVESPCGSVAIYSKEEAEAQIALLQLALDDVNRLYDGKPPLSAFSVRTRQ